MNKLLQNQIIKNILTAIFFGLISYIAGKIQFKIPGFDETTTDLREIPIQISILYLNNPLYQIIVSFITSFEAPTLTLYISTFVTHAASGIFLFYAYKYIISKTKHWIKNSFYWLSGSVLYYLGVLFVTNTVLRLILYPPPETGFIHNYFGIITKSGSEIFLTALTSTLYFMQFNTRLALREKIKWIDFIIKNTNIAYWTWNIKQNTITYNNDWAVIKKNKVGTELQFYEFEKLLHSDESDNVKNIIQSEIKNGSFNIEHRIKTNHNQWTWVLSQGKVITFDQENKPEICVGMHIDISKLKKAAEEKKELEKKYSEIFNSTNDAILILENQTFKIIEANKALYKILEFTETEIKNKFPDIFCDPNSNQYSYKTLENHLKESAFDRNKQTEWLSVTKSGQKKWINISIIRTIIQGEKKILLVIRNINAEKQANIELQNYKDGLEILVKERTEELEATNEELRATNEELYIHREELESTIDELHKSQEKLIEAEKMASIGVLAAGVAHEINNPLNFIQGGISGIEFYIEDNIPEHKQAMKPLLEAVYTGIKRASAIVVGLNHYSRQSESTTENCNIHSIIDNCLIILENSLKYKVQILKNYSDQNITITGNDGKLHQAILNIIRNAEQAIEKKGIIEIKTQTLKNEILISISDSGKGIQPEYLQKITDPFFTTKEAGQGTGLGLSITKNIIEAHNGKITFDSQFNKGTTVTITLPIN